jgi:hypothetical protein
MDKLDHLGWVVSSSYAIGDLRFAVRSTSPAFGDWLSDVLGAYEVDDVEDFLYSVVVPDPPGHGAAKGFFILYRGSSAIVRTLDPRVVGRSMLAELESLQLGRRDDAVYVTARLVGLPNGWALAPPSIGQGVANLGRRAAKIGVSVSVGPATAIDLDTASVMSIPPALQVPGDAPDRLARMFPWGGDDAHRPPEKLDAIDALLVPARNEARAIQPTRKGFALATLAGWTVNLGLVGGRGLQALGRLVERTGCYESTWTDGSELIGQLAALSFDTSGSSP